LLLLLPLVLSTLPAAVQAQFDYAITNGTVTVTRYTGSGGDVTIPDTIDGLAVTSIGDGAFFQCTSLTGVTIPHGLAYIGEAAFCGCASLTSITIPNSVTTIGACAFSSCTSLTAVTIPNSVRHWLTIEVTGGAPRSDAFSFCTNLTSLTLADGIPSIPSFAFAGCSSLTNFTIPSSVTNIGPCAFGWCPSLTSVTIPNSVTSIGYWAFIKCSNLMEVTVGSGVTYLGGGAFEDCTSLRTVTICTGVTSIEGWVFCRCTNLSGVYFRGNAPSLGMDVFDGADRATVYYLLGTTGWDSTFGGRPTTPWWLPYPVILTTAPHFGVPTNGFSFIISWATNASVVVEAATDLNNPTWSPLGTNALAEGWSQFSDPQWMNCAARFYRVVSVP
jgi:hypothetical protein